MREEGLSMAEEIEWFVGIDWASQSQQVLPGRSPAESAWASEPLRMAARGSRSCAIG